MPLRTGPPGHSDLLICVDYINAVLFTKHPSLVTWCATLQIWSCALLGNYGSSNCEALPAFSMAMLASIHRMDARTDGVIFCATDT